MDLQQAITFAFDDKQWVSKLALVALFTILTILFPVGIIALAIVLGYSIEIITNVRNGQPDPLPQWENYTDKLSKGGHVLLALLVHLLPILVLGVGVLGISFNSDSVFGSTVSVIAFACILPIGFLYGLVVTAMLAVGIARYSLTGNRAMLYRFADNLATIREHFSLTLQYIVVSLVVSLGIGFIGWIPCLGWIAAGALAIPIQAHLIGQFALQLGLGKDKR